MWQGLKLSTNSKYSQETYFRDHLHVCRDSLLDPFVYVDQLDRFVIKGVAVNSSYNIDRVMYVISVQKLSSLSLY